MVESKKLANLKGFLIPFTNGVLNSRTKQFFPHSKDYYLTHLLPFDYNPNTDLNNFKNTNMYNFLSHLCDHNETKLEVLRACLNAIITNDVSYQLSLYLYGPGGTGKSTLVNILMFILGSEGSFSTTLSKLTNRFSTYSLMNKVLLVLNDIPLFRGKEPDFLKIIITSDPIEMEQKYKAPFQFKPNLFVLITSNSI
jgi:putative DNA primase/helicase